MTQKQFRKMDEREQNKALKKLTCITYVKYSKNCSEMFCNSFSSALSGSVIEFLFFTVEVKVDQTPVHLQLCDTAGQVRIISLFY